VEIPKKIGKIRNSKKKIRIKCDKVKSNQNHQRKSRMKCDKVKSNQRKFECFKLAPFLYYCAVGISYFITSGAVYYMMMNDASG